MPPKRRAVAKKVKVPVEVYPNELIVDNTANKGEPEDIENDQNEISTPQFTVRRPFGQEKCMDENPFEKDDEKVRMLEDRMANTNQSNNQPEIPELEEKVSKAPKSKSKKDDPKEKKLKKRAISEDRQNKIDEKVIVKNSKKQGKGETVFSPLNSPIKKNRRGASVDRVASEIGLTNVEELNQKSNDLEKPKRNKRVLKKEESIPCPIIIKNNTKPKRAIKKLLNYGENEIGPEEEDNELPESKPKLNKRGIKKKQVDKEFTEDLDANQELQTGNAAQKTSKLLKDKKPKKNALKSKEVVKTDTDSSDNVIQDTLEDPSDKNSTDSDTVEVNSMDEVEKSLEEQMKKDFDKLVAISESRNIDIPNSPEKITKRVRKGTKQQSNNVEEKKSDTKSQKKGRKAKGGAIEEDILIVEAEGEEIETEDVPKKRKAKAKAKK